MSTFTSTHAYQVLERACREVGEISDGAEMLRLGENALFRLAGPSSPVVVRVARDMTRLGIARRELCVSRWLSSTGQVPAARVHEGVSDQPRVVDGHPVTFWGYVEPDTDDRPTVADLARILRGLHTLPASPCELPPFDPLGAARVRLERGTGFTAAERTFLLARCDALETMLPELEFPLPPGPIHGDAHTGNLLGRSGGTFLTYFEVFSVGSREWDSVPLAVGAARFGIPPQQWGEFVVNYGFDVRAWSGYPVLREIREVGMTTWLAQNVAEGEHIVREVALRVRCIRDGDLDHAWTAF